MWKNCVLLQINCDNKMKKKRQIQTIVSQKVVNRIVDVSALLRVTTVSVTKK